MRFVLGFGAGFAIGFAGALLFAPDGTKRRRVEWPAGTVEAGPPAFEEDGNVMGAVKSALRSIQEAVDEARAAAREAQAETEREMRQRYETSLHRKVEDKGD
jgi:gas vesicle protein